MIVLLLLLWLLWLLSVGGWPWILFSSFYFYIIFIFAFYFYINIKLIFFFFFFSDIFDILFSSLLLLLLYIFLYYVNKLQFRLKKQKQCLDKITVLFWEDDCKQSTIVLQHTLRFARLNRWLNFIHLFVRWIDWLGKTQTCLHVVWCVEYRPQGYDNVPYRRHCVRFCGVWGYGEGDCA